MICSKVDPKLQTTSDTRARDAMHGASLSTAGRLTLNAELLDLPDLLAGGALFHNALPGVVTIGC
jgi:hypothetical protein